MDWKSRVVTVSGLVALAACASVVGSTESAVEIRTNPDRARCALSGYGFSAQVDTPATILLPHSAAPVAVNCTAPGFRPTSYTLDAKADGWIWANSALFIATGGIAVLGAVVDESRGAGRAYAEHVQYDLAPDTARQIRLKQRNGDFELDLRVR